MAAYFNESKMYTYLKGFAMGGNLHETLEALTYARKLHNGQFRKSGEPYIIHPLIMACHAVSLGVINDDIIATILLHDVVEDCGVSVNDLPVSETVRKAVNLLTYRKPEKYLERDGEGISIKDVKTEYYKKISENPIAAIAKLFDRCHNVSSMAGTFTKEKLFDYIDETKDYVMPLLRKTKDDFPEYQNVLFVLKYHIVSVLEAIEGTTKMLVNEKYCE